MKEDTVQLRVRNKKPGSSRGTPKSRHGYLSSTRIKQRMHLLGEYQTYSLEDKFALSAQIMREAITKVKRILIGWSGGKDSTLLIEIALRAGVMDRVEVVYVDSGVEPPETLAYVDLYAKLRNLKYTRLKAPTSFWQMTRTHGWPILGGDRFAMPGTWKVNAAIARKRGDELAALAITRARISGACSDVLKKVPMDRHARYVGSDCTAMGLMAQECLLLSSSYGATKRGLIRLDKIKAGTYIADGHSLSLVKRSVNAGICPVFRVKLLSGLELITHPHHRVRTVSGLQGEATPSLTWTQVKDLKRGQPVLIEGKRTFDSDIPLNIQPREDRLVATPSRMTPELAWLVGYFDGNGSFRGKGGKYHDGISFSVSSDDFPLVREHMWNVFKAIPILKPKHTKQLYISTTKGWRTFKTFDLIYNSAKLKDFFHAISTKGEAGDWFFENCGAYFPFYLYGRIQADGHSDGEFWSLYVTNKKASEQIQQLCFLSGFWCSRSCRRWNRDEKRGVWSLHITPPLGKVKGNDWLSRNKRLPEERCERGYLRCSPAVKDWLRRNRLFIDEVKFVEKLSTHLPLGDFTTIPSHTYVSNCFISHNTRQRMLVWLQKGHFYFHSGDKKWILWPIWHWKPDEVLQYFRTNNIPMCALYDPGRLSRNGCQPCMKSWKWPDNNFIDTYKHHPDTWWDFMFRRGLCQKLWEIKKIYHRSQIFRYGFDINASPAKVKSYAEKHPEFFWQL